MTGDAVIEAVLINDTTLRSAKFPPFPPLSSREATQVYLKVSATFEGVSWGFRGMQGVSQDALFELISS